MKDLIRTKILYRRKHLRPSFVSSKSRSIFIKIFDLEVIKKSEHIALYYPKNNEVNTREIINRLLRLGKKIYLPCIEKKQLLFRRINNIDTDLVLGKYGIMQPKADCEVISNCKLDLLIMPCVAVDVKGNRIGMGAGYYDKFLAVHKVKTICLAYDFQIVDEIMSEGHDIKVDMILTEYKLINLNCKIIDGKKIANKILSDIKDKIKRENIKAKLVVILVGNDPASEVYVKNKKTKCEEVGIAFELIELEDNIEEEQLLCEINNLNKRKDVTAILVQLPLPKHIHPDIVKSIIIEKDADGFNNQDIIPGTPKGIMKLIESTGVDLTGKNAVVVGRSNSVGKPTAMLLLEKDATVTICHSKTKHLAEYTKQADVLVCAVGKPRFIRSFMVKKDSIVIDVGINRDEHNKLIGDVDFDNVKHIAKYITPVPGGVGPMTVAMLIDNILCLKGDAKYR